MTTEEYLYLIGYAIVVIVVLKIAWRIFWGVLNWAVDKIIRKRLPDVYETLVPMVDYTPFYELFADQETIDRRAASNATRKYLMERNRRR